MNQKLGKLKEIDVRKIWGHEQYDFSKWLAQPENISSLSEALGLELTDIETEKSVGGYRCDILCKDQTTNTNVLIENQLEQTNHDHLGKLITYASGLDASVVVWIVTHAREEHCSAVEWLNKQMESCAFFLVEVHAYKIGESEPAPLFKIIEQPNDFAKQVKSSSEKGAVSEAEAKRFEFWTKFNERIDEKKYPINKRKPWYNHWYSVAMGTSSCHIDINLVNQAGQIRIEVWIRDDKELYEQFYSNKEEIESKLGLDLEWDKKEGRKASSISYSFDGLDFDHQDNYPELMDKIIEYVLKMKKAFSPYIK